MAQVHLWMIAHGTLKGEIIDASTGILLSNAQSSKKIIQEKECSYQSTYAREDIPETDFSGSTILQSGEVSKFVIMHTQQDAN